MARGQSPAPSVVALAADASLVSSSVSARSAMEAADVPVMFVAVQQKLNRKRFDDLSSTPPSESSAGRGYRLVLRTPSELRLQGCRPAFRLDLTWINVLRSSRRPGTDATLIGWRAAQRSIVGVSQVQLLLHRRKRRSDIGHFRGTARIYRPRHRRSTCRQGHYRQGT